MDDLTAAADAADDLLVGMGSDARVLRDPAEVLENADVFVFTRSPSPVDDTMLVVDKDTVLARIVTSYPWEPPPFPGLVRVDDTED